MGEFRWCNLSVWSLTRAGYSFEELRHAGYPEKELFNPFRSDAFNLEKLGYTIEEILMKFRNDLTALCEAGFSPAFLEAAGFSLEDMKEAGFSWWELREFFSLWLIPLNEKAEYPQLQSLMHEMGNRRGSVNRQMRNLLLLNPCVRRRLL